MKTIVLKGYKEEELKEYLLEDLPGCGYRILSLPNTCYFCKNCTDIWWDYSNGPYMFSCDKEQEVDEDLVWKKGLIGKCEYFEEEI